MSRKNSKKEQDKKKDHVTCQRKGTTSRPLPPSLSLALPQAPIHVEVLASPSPGLASENRSARMRSRVAHPASWRGRAPSPPQAGRPPSGALWQHGRAPAPQARADAGPERQEDGQHSREMVQSRLSCGSKGMSEVAMTRLRKKAPLLF